MDWRNFNWTMEMIYESDAAYVEALQTRLQNYKDVMIGISNLFDPRYAFLIYSPILFSFDFKAGRRLMFVVIMMEWSNHLLKWLLHGERPYWWIHETKIYNTSGLSMPVIQQFPATCETGPGNPSGHSQSTAAVWYVMLDTFLHKYDPNYQNSNTFISNLGTLIYIILIVAVGTSRTFIAAHFPHQCYLGTILGWAEAEFLQNISQVKCSTLQYSAITVGMMSSALFVYALLQLLGSDPNWTIDRAFKWCADQRYVHLETTPLYSMMRYCGYMLGMGFGFNSTYFKHNHKLEFTIQKKILCALLSVGVCLLSEVIVFNNESHFVYYVQVFLLNTILAYIVIAIIPTLVKYFLDV